jgi:hypothetical protein
MEDWLEVNPYLFPIFAVTLYCVILAALARLGGWSALADRYRAFDSYAGPMKRHQSASLLRFGVLPMGYNNIVDFGADQFALHASIFVLFRAFHPPLAIPWSDIAAEAHDWGPIRFVDLSAAGAPRVKIRIARRLADWLAERSAGALQLPAAPIAALPRTASGSRTARRPTRSSSP